MFVCLLWFIHSQTLTFRKSSLIKNNCSCYLLWFQRFPRRSETNFTYKWFCWIVIVTKLSSINRLILIMQLWAYYFEFLSGLGRPSYLKLDDLKHNWAPYKKCLGFQVCLVPIATTKISISNLSKDTVGTSASCRTPAGKSCVHAMDSYYSEACICRKISAKILSTNNGKKMKSRIEWSQWLY